MQEMARVIHALILREIQSRFGRQRLGFLWALLEPLLFVSVLTVIFSLRGRYHPPGMTLVLFLITGISPFLLFRHTMRRGIRGQEANNRLLAFPQVQVMDIAVARFLLELCIGITVFVILLVGVGLLDLEPIDIQYPLGVLAGILIMGLYGFALGLVFGSLMPMFPGIGNFIQIFLGRPLFFVSGVFFTIEMVPREFRHILLVNPLFHVLEWLRSMFFTQYESRYADMAYSGIWLVVLLFLGLVMQRALRRHSFAL
jgi:capsular polysaccharide transport system permease protein